MCKDRISCRDLHEKVAGLFVPEQFQQPGENIWDLRFPMTNPCLGRAENILLVHSLKNR